VEFRRTYDGEGRLGAMRRTLVIPHLETLRRFEPFMTVPPWSVLRKP